jgi:hypothetical protein
MAQHDTKHSGEQPAASFRAATGKRLKQVRQEEKSGHARIRA